jgi:tRNA 2-selenouridine synthase SelU
MATFEEYNLLWLNSEFSTRKPAKEHAFLYKYFDRKIQKLAMEYFYTMGEDNIYLFQDHTGYKVTPSFLYKQYFKFKNLISIYNKAKKNLDFNTLRNLDQGKIKIKNLGEINAN